MNRRPRVWLVIFLCATAAGAVRFWGLGTEAIWMDEAATLRAIRGSIWDVLGQYNDYENTPPLYYFFLHVWVSIAGDSNDALLRLPSALFSVATVVLTSWVASLLAGRRTLVPAVVSGGLMAFCTMQIAYGQEVRAYAMWTMFAAASTGLMLKGARSNGWRCWFAYATTALAMAFTHFGAIPVLMAHVGYVLSGWRSLSSQVRRYSIAAFVLISLASIPLVPDLLKTRSRMQGGEPRTSVGAVDHTARTYVQLAGGPSLLLAIVPAVGMMLVRRSIPVRDRVLVIGLAVLPALVPVMAWWSGGAQYFPRHALAAGIGLTLAAGIGVAALDRRWHAPAVAGILLLAIVSHILLRGELRKPAMREAAALVAANALPGDTVVVSLLMSGWSFDRYVERADLRRRNYDEFTVKHIATSGERINRVWLVLCPATADETVMFKDSPLTELFRTDFPGVRVIELSRQTEQPVE